MLVSEIEYSIDKGIHMVCNAKSKFLLENVPVYKVLTSILLEIMST